MQFVQPDRIIPQPFNPQSLNRYAYVLNNPLRFIDPSGHVTCEGANWDDGPRCIGKSTFKTKATAELKSVLKNRYDWNVASDFTLTELNKLYQTGKDIERYADAQTGGNGLDWMLAALGNTTIKHVSFKSGRSFALPSLSGSVVLLDKNWLSHGWGAKVLFSHELGHVWDINSWFTHSGEMNRSLGGSSWCYICALGNGVPQWDTLYHTDASGDAYGNSGRNEYFAEAFSTTIYPPDDNILVPAGASEWMRLQILQETLRYLYPRGLQ